MKKIINIDGRDVAFVANGALPLRFMQETGKDLFEIAMPIIGSIVPLLPKFLPLLYDKKAKDKEVETMLVDSLGEINLDSLFYQIKAWDIMTLVYVMAKEGNKDIDEMVEWYESFDSLPAYSILKELFPMLIKTFGSKVEPKNAQAAAVRGA